MKIDGNPTFSKILVLVYFGFHNWRLLLPLSASDRAKARNPLKYAPETETSGLFHHTLVKTEGHKVCKRKKNQGETPLLELWLFCKFSRQREDLFSLHYLEASRFFASSSMLKTELLYENVFSTFFDLFW